MASSARAPFFRGARAYVAEGKNSPSPLLIRTQRFAIGAPLECRKAGSFSSVLRPRVSMREPLRSCSSDRVSKTSEAQNWNAEDYRQNCSFVPKLGLPVLELLAPRSGELILDLGCGDGTLTKLVVEAGCDVTAIDSSEAMIRLARSEGLKAYLMDAHHLSYAAEFDAVFTNAALHWMRRDPRAVVRGVRRALKPGGRFVGEAGGFGNVAAITTALLAVLKGRGIHGPSRIPWFFPTAEEYREILQEEGFLVETIELIPRPTELPAGIANWMENFCDSFFEGMREGERRAAMEEAEEILRPSLCDRGGKWTADYVRLRFRAALVANF